MLLFDISDLCCRLWVTVSSYFNCPSFDVVVCGSVLEAQLIFAASKLTFVGKRARIVGNSRDLHAFVWTIPAANT
jgi:hypothetical protein